LNIEPVGFNLAFLGPFEQNQENPLNDPICSLILPISEVWSACEVMEGREHLMDSIEYLVSLGFLSGKGAQWATLVSC
jgi:hypothetical protein